MKVYSGKIPWQLVGNEWTKPGVCAYPWPSEGIVWQDNVPFHRRMQFTGYYRGRSAAGFEMVDHDGFVYPVFMSDMDAIIKHGIESGGYIEATWIVSKRGQNYGVLMVEEDNDSI